MSQTQRDMLEDMLYKVEPQSIKPNGVEYAVNKYQRECKGIFIDVYDVLKAFNVTNPAQQHAIKKMLAPGQRGVKDFKQDLQEAITSLNRAIELES